MPSSGRSDAMLSDRSLHEPRPLKKAVRRSGGAMAVAQVASQVVSLAGLAVLMRLLTPTDYGLIGMVLPLVMLLRIFTTLGLNIATVQRRELHENEVTGLFWVNVGMGVATTAVTLAIAPAVGRFYGQPELVSPLKQVTWALAATSIIAAVGTQHLALLERNLRLPKLAAIRIGAQAIAVAVAIAAAFRGWGVWALILQQYVELCLLTALAWWAVAWRPGPPRHAGSVYPLLRFGAYFAASSLILFAANSIDRVLVGKLIGAAAAGLYSQASNVMLKPVLLMTTPLTAILLASLSRAGTSDQTYRELLLAYYRAAAVLMLPAGVGLMVVGSDVMTLLGGAGWRDAGPLLMALSAGLFGHAVLILNAYVLTAAGRTDWLLLAATAELLAMFSGCLAGWMVGRGWAAPTLGIAIGYAVTTLALVVPFTWFCVHTAGQSVWPLFAAWRRPLKASLAMGLFVWMFGQWLSVASTTVRLIVLVPLGAAVYAAVARQDIAWLVSQFLQIRRSQEK